MFVGESLSFEVAQECLDRIKSFNKAIFTTNTDSKTELALIQAFLVLSSHPEDLVDRLKLVFSDSSFDDASRYALQALICRKAEEYSKCCKVQNAIDLYQICEWFQVEADPVDQRNKATMKRRIVHLLLSLGKLEEAEQEILLLPMDTEGIYLRIELHMSINREADARLFLAKLGNQPDSTVDHFLGLAKFCQGKHEGLIMLESLQYAFDKCDNDPQRKGQILKSIVSFLPRLTEPTNKSELFLKYLGHCRDDNNSNNDGEFYFKISWNAALDSIKEERLLDACHLLMMALSFLDESSEEARMMTNIPLLRTAIITENIDQPVKDSLMERLNESKQPAKKKMKKIRNDVGNVLAILEFQCLIVLAMFEEASSYLTGALLNSSYKVMEEIAGWTLANGAAPLTSIIFSPFFIHNLAVHIELLKILVQKFTEADCPPDIAKFSMIYRGLFNAALLLDQEQRPDAFELFNQGLTIIKVSGNNYPSQEITWMSITAFNYSIHMHRYLFCRLYL
jgi:hypothetical protein